MTAATTPPRTLHLVREGEAPLAVVAERDWVVYLQTMELAARGGPPYPAGPLDHDQLLDLIIRAERVVTW